MHERRPWTRRTLPMPRPQDDGPPGLLLDPIPVDGRPPRIRFTKRGWRLVAVFFAVHIVAALIWPSLWPLVLFWLVMLLCRNWLPWLPGE